MEREVVVIDELGNIKGYAPEKDVHNPANPLLHLSSAVLIWDKGSGMLGVRRSHFSSDFPFLYDFALHRHIYKGEEDVNLEVILSKEGIDLSKEVIQTISFIYFYNYYNQKCEYEKCSVIVLKDITPSKKHISSLTFVPLHTLNRENTNPRLYTFVKYYFPYFKEGHSQNYDK